MSETLPEDRSPEPITTDSIAGDLRAPAVVDALLGVVGREGTVVMPTHSPGNRDPSNMNNPPIPDSWYETVRERMPPYRPAVTPTQGMGAIAECFRSYPDTDRSAHPQHSFAAWGADAGFVVGEHPYDDSLGEESPLGRVYELGGDVLFLGTTHATNTSLHLAEYRADLGLETKEHASAVLVDGSREWIQWEDPAIDDGDFPECGAAFERERPEAVERGAVGVGEAKLLDQRSLVDFGVEWFEATRE